MSTEKHEQLIAEGKLWPDGTRKEFCPMCGKPLEQGETLGTVTVAAAEAHNAEVGQ